MGIPRQEVKTTSSGLPDNQIKQRFQFIPGDLKGRTYGGVVTNTCYLQSENRINNKLKRKNTLSIGKRLRTQVPKPSHYECPKGPALIEAARKRIDIQVLLDS